MRSNTRRIPLALCAGAALLLLPGVALAAAVPDNFTQRCSDKLQLETLKYVNQVQKRIRLSIKNNLKGKSSKCGHKFFACAGGANNQGKCDPATIPANGDCPGGQCQVDTTKGVAGQINKAKGKLRDKFAQFCTNPQLAALGFPNQRCPDANSPATVADCVLEGAIGDISAAVFGDPAGEILGRAATNVVGGTPVGVCAVTLGSVLQIGSKSTDSTVAEAGGAAPLDLDACPGDVCTTSGQGVVGNNLTAPTDTAAGALEICLLTTVNDAGNGTPQSGVVHIGGPSVGLQTSFAPIESKVIIGAPCPKCIGGVCDAGPNSGQPCTSPGGTDTACPPTFIAPPIVPNPLNLTTEVVSLSVPSHNPGGGVTNPTGTFCGNCDNFGAGDITLSCQNDSECLAEGICDAPGCCKFGTNTGAFGDDQAVTVTAQGARGPYLPRLATVFCTGASGHPVVDPTQGLPGPVRLVQQQLNTFTY